MSKKESTKKRINGLLSDELAGIAKLLDALNDMQENDVWAGETVRIIDQETDDLLAVVVYDEQVNEYLLSGGCAK